MHRNRRATILILLGFPLIVAACSATRAPGSTESSGAGSFGGQGSRAGGFGGQSSGSGQLSSSAFYVWPYNGTKWAPAFGTAPGQVSAATNAYGSTGEFWIAVTTGL